MEYTIIKIEEIWEDPEVTNSSYHEELYYIVTTETKEKKEKWKFLKKDLNFLADYLEIKDRDYLIEELKYKTVDDRFWQLLEFQR